MSEFCFDFPWDLPGLFLAAFSCIAAAGQRGEVEDINTAPQSVTAVS